jgi:hypothetical protein
MACLYLKEYKTNMILLIKKHDRKFPPGIPKK